MTMRFVKKATMKLTAAIVFAAIVFTSIVFASLTVTAAGMATASTSGAATPSATGAATASTSGAATSTATAPDLWVNRDDINETVRTFQCLGPGELEIRFFTKDGTQMNFYVLQDDFYVDDAGLVDEYLRKGMTDAGDFVVVSQEETNIRYPWEMLGDFGHLEVTVKPAPGAMLSHFTDLSCGCGTDLELVDGVYHVFDFNYDAIGVVFIDATVDDSFVDSFVGSFDDSFNDSFVDSFDDSFNDNTGAAPELTMTLNGNVIHAEVAPFIENERTMVPVRLISEAFGAEVAWNSEIKLVTVTAPDGTTINLTIDSEDIIINGTAVKMDTAAIIKDGRTFVPVRYVAEALGLSVEWVGETRTINFSL